MMNESVKPLIEVLAAVPDFRRAEGKRHPLPAILALVCAATLCGYRSYGAMAEWSRHYGAELAVALGFKNGKTPCVGTLHTILTRLDHQALEAALGQWAQAVLAAHDPTKNTTNVVAVDGKTLRGSARQGAPGTHLLAALSPALGLTLHQQAVDDKSNEITAVQEVLKSLVLEGRVVTVDALLTQREVAQTIIDKKGTISCQ
jgi:hypothetical protein